MPSAVRGPARRAGGQAKLDPCTAAASRLPADKIPLPQPSAALRGPSASASAVADFTYGSVMQGIGTAPLAPSFEAFLPHLHAVQEAVIEMGGGHRAMDKLRTPPKGLATQAAVTSGGASAGAVSGSPLTGLATGASTSSAPFTGSGTPVASASPAGTPTPTSAGTAASAGGAPAPARDPKAFFSSLLTKGKK